jgi:hypothetical protein
MERGQCSRSFLLNMEIRLQNCLAISGAIILHALLLLLPSPKLELGKNTPTLDRPLRTRVVSVQLSQDNHPQLASQPTVQQQKATVMPPPGAVLEGSTDHNDKTYTDIRERYFRPSELDATPAVVTPLDLGASKISPVVEGDAIVRFFINEYGSVDRMEIEKSTLPEGMVEQLYLQREHLHFTPGRKDGLDVKSVVAYRIHLDKAPVTVLTGSGGH